MTESPPPLDYRAPEPKPPIGFKFFGGLLLGGVLTAAAIPLSLIIAFVAGREGRDPAGEALGLLPVGGLLLLVIVCCVNRRSRHFGLGLLAGLPLGVLTIFAICGGMR